MSQVHHAHGVKLRAPQIWFWKRVPVLKCHEVHVRFAHFLTHATLCDTFWLVILSVMKHHKLSYSKPSLRDFFLTRAPFSKNPFGMGLLDKLKQTCPCEHGWALLNARLDRHTRCSKLSDLIAIAICDSHRDSRTLNRTIFCSDGGPVPVRLPARRPLETTQRVSVFGGCLRLWRPFGSRQTTQTSTRTTNWHEETFSRFHCQTGIRL